MNIKAIEAKLAAKNAELQAILEPHNAKITELENVFEKATRGIKDRIDELDKELRNRKAHLQSRADRRLLNRNLLRPPTSFKEFEQFVERSVAKIHESLSPRFGCDEEVKCAKLEGFVIFCARSRYDKKGEKVYGAWTTGGKFVGAMKVEPSKYPGYSTWAFALVNGKKIFERHDERYYSGVEKPVEKFFAALKGN